MLMKNEALQFAFFYFILAQFHWIHNDIIPFSLALSLYQSSGRYLLNICYAQPFKETVVPGCPNMLL
jgi:hypothetical protein